MPIKSVPKFQPAGQPGMEVIVLMKKHLWDCTSNLSQMLFVVHSENENFSVDFMYIETKSSPFLDVPQQYKTNAGILGSIQESVAHKKIE